MINLFDLDEDHDPNLPYVDGSNLDGAGFEIDDIEECAKQLCLKAVN